MEFKELPYHAKKYLIDSSRHGYVYMLEAKETKRFKIGYSKNPLVRGQQINCQSPYPIKVIDYFWSPDARTDEKHLHELLDKSRVHGEYFEFGNSLKDLEVTAEFASYFKDEHFTLRQGDFLRYVSSFYMQNYSVYASYTLTKLSITSMEHLSVRYSKYGERATNDICNLSGVYKNVQSVEELHKAYKFIYEIIPKYIDIITQFNYGYEADKAIIETLINGYIERIYLDE